MVARGCTMEKWGRITNRYGAPFWSGENVLELDSGDGSTTL